MQPTSVPQVFLFGQKAHPSQLQVLFSMQMRGVGLKNGVPYLQMGLLTLASRVSRRPEDQRTSFNQLIPRRFFSLASRHSTSGLHTRRWYKDVDKKEQNTSAPQVSLFDHKTYQNLLQGRFSMQIRGYLEERRPMLPSRVSRRPEDQKTSFNQSIARRFFRLTSRHSFSGLHTSAERKLAHTSA